MLFDSYTKFLLVLKQYYCFIVYKTGHRKAAVAMKKIGGSIYSVGGEGQRGGTQ